MVTGQDADKHENQLTGTEHMVIIVSFGDGSTWLTDVGFGGQVARHPLRIDQLDLDPLSDGKGPVVPPILSSSLSTSLFFSFPIALLCKPLRCRLHSLTLLVTKEAVVQQSDSRALLIDQLDPQIFLSRVKL